MKKTIKSAQHIEWLGTMAEWNMYPTYVTIDTDLGIVYSSWFTGRAGFEANYETGLLTLQWLNGEFHKLPLGEIKFTFAADEDAPATDIYSLADFILHFKEMEAHDENYSEWLTRCLVRGAPHRW